MFGEEGAGRERGGGGGGSAVAAGLNMRTGKGGQILPSPHVFCE